MYVYNGVYDRKLTIYYEDVIIKRFARNAQSKIY